MRLILVTLCLCLLPAQQRQPPSASALDVFVTTDPNNAGIDGAEVEIQRLEGGRTGRVRQDSRKCQTENGRCSFRVFPGNYLVTVSKRGYFDAVDPLSARYSEQVLVQPLGSLQLQVPMVPAGSVSGAVFTEDDKPIPQAFLRARIVGSDPDRPPLQRWVYSDDRGEFSLDDLPPGRYGLFLVPPESVRFKGLQKSNITGEFTGYAVQMFHPGVEEASWVTPVEITPGLHLDHRTVVTRRLKVYSVSGALVDPSTREPLLAATVAVRTDDEYNAELFAPRPVRADGSFEFHSLAPGDYNLLVYRNGREIPWIVPFRISPTSQPDLLLEVPQWRTVLAEIDDIRRGRYPRATRLVLEAENNTGDVAVAVAEPGPISMGQLPPGRYRFRVESEEGIYAARARQGDINIINEDVTVTTGGAVNLRVALGDETGDMIGTMVDDEGDPVGQGWVLLAPADPKRRARGDLNRKLRVSSDGAFFLPQIPPGEYLLLGLPKRPAVSLATSELWERHRRYVLKLPVLPGVQLPVGLPIATGE